MNYNFSNNFNSVQILPSKQKNSLNEAQVLLLCTFLSKNSDFYSFEAKFSRLSDALET